MWNPLKALKDKYSKAKSETNKIKTDISNMEAAIKKIDKSISEYKETSKQLKKVRNQVASSWEGKAAEDYINRLDKFAIKPCDYLSDVILPELKSNTQSRINKLRKDNSWYKNISRFFGS